MHTPVSNIIGICAASLTTVSLLPQVFKTHRTKQTRDLSLGMFVVFITGLFFWLAYGVLIKSIPIILGNIITTSLAVYLLVMKLKYK